MFLFQACESYSPVVLYLSSIELLGENDGMDVCMQWMVLYLHM